MCSEQRPSHQHVQTAAEDGIIVCFFRICTGSEFKFPICCSLFTLKVSFVSITAAINHFVSYFYIYAAGDCRMTQTATKHKDRNQFKSTSPTAPPSSASCLVSSTASTSCPLKTQHPERLCSLLPCLIVSVSPEGARATILWSLKYQRVFVKWR